MTYLARHDGRQPVRLTSQIGRRLPASVTATGKAALASLDPDEVERRFDGDDAAGARPADRSPTVDALLADLDVVRRRGYSMDDEETVEGVVCFGVADPGPAARGGAVRGEHHAPQGAGDRSTGSRR